MAKKTVPFSSKGIGNVPINKPILYNILTEGGKTNYTGVAKRGRGQERLKEHLLNGKDPIPGAKVTVEQMPSIREAKTKEAETIGRKLPPHNKQGK